MVTGFLNELSMSNKLNSWLDVFGIFFFFCFSWCLLVGVGVFCCRPPPIVHLLLTTTTTVRFVPLYCMRGECFKMLSM